MAHYDPPVELASCHACGCKAELHRSRSGKWYVKCSKKKCENRTEECASKLTICKTWNVRNK